MAPPPCGASVHCGPSVIDATRQRHTGPLRSQPMNLTHRRGPPLRPFALGGALLRGLFEIIALWRSRETLRG